MRAAPSLQVVVTRFGVWRAGVGLIGLLAAGLTVGWAGWYLAIRGGSQAAPELTGGAIAALAATFFSARLAASRSFDLRWDGRAWHLGRPSAPAADPVVGDLQVAIDLGGWLLLRFDAFPPPGERPRRYWLPLQRGGLESAWHGLRCAVYSPRPAPGVAEPDATA